MTAQDLAIAALVGLAALGLARTLAAKAGLGRARPDCGCGACDRRKAAR